MPALTDDLVDEILLRFPPEEPELLVRAALVCKRWFRLISDPRFRRRFRELHRAAPMLGLFCARFSTSSFVHISSVPLPHAIRGDRRAVVARHGRVLVNTASYTNYSFNYWGDDLVVWDPVTGEQHRLPKLPEHMYSHPYCCNWTAAALCAAAEGGCDHLNCHRGPFLVPFVCTGSREALACAYSSETGPLEQPLQVRDQEKVLQVHERLNEVDHVLLSKGGTDDNVSVGDAGLKRNLKHCASGADLGAGGSLKQLLSETRLWW
ncbi:hypothetical protein BAE44_0003909 [Dichanthelium oligosanthes]|uniref:F-box domain-containing protein n=1 Tax=Dichanthelium oligosanthes TaxID=888268 RepID=A0A1E5WCF6_9POAL|nr:hypothetical protein BAE44_0003909 [Dichanthelium oligosanthes]